MPYHKDNFFQTTVFKVFVAVPLRHHFFLAVKILDPNFFIKNLSFVRLWRLIMKKKKFQSECNKNVISLYHVKDYVRVGGNLIMLTHQKLLYMSIFPKTGNSCILGMRFQKLSNVTRKIMY